VTPPAEHPAVRWLRNYSDYLTPKIGIFTGDAGAVLGNWSRNVFLNQLVLVLFLLGLILVPSWLVLFTQHVIEESETSAIVAFFFGVALIVFAIIATAKCMVPMDEFNRRGGWLRNSVRLSVMLPLFVAAWLMNSSMLAWKDLSDGTLLYWMLGGMAFYFLVWMAAAAVANSKKRERAEKTTDSSVVSWPALYIAAAIAGLLGGLLLNRYAFFVGQIARESEGFLWTLNILGTVAVLFLLQLVAVLQLGLVGHDCLDLVREWWARVGGSLMLMTIGWLVVFGIVVFGPLGIRLLFNTRTGTGLNAWGLLMWLASTVAGIGAGKSPQTSGQNKSGGGGASGKIMDLLKSPKGKEIVAKVAPYVFIAGLLVILSTIVHYVAGLCFRHGETQNLWRLSGAQLSTTEIWKSYWCIQEGAQWLPVVLAAVVLIVLAGVLSWRIDVNNFSMHHFYRNRLVRCYLGASRNVNRKPQDFTGFDPDDEIALASLLRTSSDGKSKTYPGLYPILNGTLNVTRGGELGFQKRKAKPFIFTPLYCGYDVNSYLPTEFGGQDKLGHSKGITLGTAMAISGAAVSPNMGYHTAPATAFFLTLFDVRLGWWMANPRIPKLWSSPGPKLGLAYLLSELVGSCDETSRYVYLSDGAHFENLGIYELIKRRCRLIVATDVGEDGSYVFGDLMSAIEKSRTDFGVDVRIDVSKIRPVAPARESENSYAVGKIHYGKDASGKEDCGILIYVKSSLPKDDPNASPENRTPSDVVSYAQSNPTFPHQSTADQWFDEVQFESYRALGEYIGNLVVKGANLKGKLEAVLSGKIRSCEDIDKTENPLPQTAPHNQPPATCTT